MAKTENLPFHRGQTWFGDQTPSATEGVHLEGKEYWVEDIDPSNTKSLRTGRMVRLRIVRNVGAAALLGKRVVRGQNSVPHATKRVDGYTRLTAEDRLGVVDEFLPSAGVPVNDLFYIVVEGPTAILTPLEGNANNVFSVGDHVVAITGATSGATTAGRVIKQDLTGATEVLGNQLQNVIGRALSAKTTGNTNADLLVDVIYKG